MTYLPHTPAERAEMLEAIGVETMEDLFADIPARVLFPGLNLPPRTTEMDVGKEMREHADRNVDVTRVASFLGAGAYNHYSPPTVDYVLQRAEFYTAYTPYQPEVSQGMLQSMFEYQSMICRLTGMEVSNASHYDGATSLAEAVRLALDSTRGRRRKVVLSPALHPQYRQVVRTYLQGSGVSLSGDEDPKTDIDGLKSLVDDQTAALVIQNPNFFGQFEDVRGLSSKVHDAGALLIAVVDPISLGLFQAPGTYGADVAVADGQSLGLPLSFGGPHLGIFATRKSYVRGLAGRLVGETVDAEGKRGYVLTLGTREQHIRRAKATSNICTNAALTALAAAVYLATLGRFGLRRVAELCYHKSHYAAAQIALLPGCRINPQAPDLPFFKEFVVGLPLSAERASRAIEAELGVLGGRPLGLDFADRDDQLLLAVTELHTREDIDALVAVLRKTVSSKVVSR